MARIVNWGTFLLVVAAAWFFMGPTSLGGPASYVVVDGSSMLPTYEDGDLVLARQQDAYRRGDVIVYDAPIDTQFNVIHRVVEPVEGGFLTQGDNMDQPDGWIAPTETIYGSAWLHVPNGGIAIAWLRQPAVVAALAAAVVTFEVLSRSEKKQRAAAEVPA